MSKVLVSGVKPTGRPHIGNYFGAMKQFVDLQDSYDSHIFVANLHTLTGLHNAAEMKQNSIEMVLDFLAIGIDPEKTTLYFQSDVPHLTELAWIFECLTTMPELMRAHAFKDAEAKNKDINVGTFNYPLLMAADILAVGGEVVPVGKDQAQHVEIARDAARDFNKVFGETFKEPEAVLVKDMFTENGSMIGTDGLKMSKSNKNTIPLFASDEEIEQAVMGIKTDSGGDGAINVRAIHYPIRVSLYPNELTGDYFTELYSRNSNNYKALKEALITDLKTFIGPMRERRAEWAAKPEEAQKIMIEGGKKMRALVHEKMKEVREKTGLIHHE